MFKRIKRLWEMSGENDLIVVARSAMTKEQAHILSKQTGKVVAWVDKVEDVKFLKRDKKKTTEEKAQFFGAGTEEEYLEQVREDEGTKPWYDRLKKLL